MAGTYTNLLYHIVFSTKDRRQLIKPTIEERLYKYMGGIIRGLGGVGLEIGGVDDHIHILVKFKPTIALSDAVRDIKANSSKWLNEQAKIYKFAWQDGFSAFTVSESQVERLRRYIRNQKTHHRRQTFQEELLELLKKNQIERDDRYLWR
jgi:REP element-mobilizing transposase RayT